MAVLAGQRLTALLFSETKEATEDGVQTFTSTSYTETPLTGDPFPSTTFVAPSSGAIKYTLQAFLDNSTTARTHMSVNIREGSSIGSGTLAFEGDDNDGIANLGADDSRHGASQIVRGLTPGLTYNIRAKGRVSSASTGTSQWRHLIVEPVIS